MNRGHVSYLWKLGLIASLLFGLLVGCNTQTSPKLPIPTDAIGFEFMVDPAQEAVTVNLITRGVEGLAQQYLPSDTRILVPEVDIGLKDYNYVFLRGNRLIIQTRFKNITATAEFVQPFFFTLNTDTANIERATAPLVMDQDSGGDGILSPGEQTSRLTFEVKHKGEPFKFFVDASAYVRETRSMWPVQLVTETFDTQSEGQDVATDPSGNIYVSGRTDGSLPGNTSAGDWDAFIAKYTPDGNPLWIKQFGTAASEWAVGVATDQDGNIYVVGQTGGSLPGNTSMGHRDAFVAKYAPDGSQLWLKQFGTATYEEAMGVATDLNGFVYVVGQTNGSLPGNTSAGSIDAFVVKYAPDGNQLWIRQFGSADFDNANGVATDQDGNVYLSGDTYDSLPGNTSAGRTDAYVAKYNADGNQLWLRQFGSASGEHVHGVASDPSGNVYVGGRTLGSLPGNTSAGDWDAFLTKYDPDGRQLWIKQFGGVATDRAHGVAIDLNGFVYVAGENWSSLPGNTNAGSADAFVVKYTPDGISLWLRQFGGAEFDLANGVATDPSGNVYVGGGTRGLPGKPSVGRFHAFVAKYDSSGTAQ